MRQKRPGYALLTMTLNLSGISQKGLFLIHSTYPIPHALHYVIITPALSLMEQLLSGTLLITVQEKIENVAKDKLVLKTYAHILLAKSGPMANPDINIANICD